MSFPGNVFDRQHAQRDPEKLCNDSRNLATPLGIADDVEDSDHDATLEALSCTDSLLEETERRISFLMRLGFPFGSKTRCVRWTTRASRGSKRSRLARELVAVFVATKEERQLVAIDTRLGALS